MKIIQADALDSLDDYRVVAVPTPSPGPGQVRVKVRACGVGYVDALTALGGYQVKPLLPNTPGSELAGVIDAIGEGVIGRKIGERVTAGGGFAEFLIAPAAHVAPIPDRLRFEQAAVSRVDYATALHGLRTAAGWPRTSGCSCLARLAASAARRSRSVARSAAM